jgi:hypothetical protein
MDLSGDVQPENIKNIRLSHLKNALKTNSFDLKNI